MFTPWALFFPNWFRFQLRHAVFLNKESAEPLHDATALLCHIRNTQRDMAPTQHQRGQTGQRFSTSKVRLAKFTVGLSPHESILAWTPQSQLSLHATGKFRVTGRWVTKAVEKGFYSSHIALALGKGRSLYVDPNVYWGTTGEEQQRRESKEGN